MKTINLPLISVIVPTKNRDLLLLRALKSVYSQTYSNIEVIVVDDGSEINKSEQLVASFPSIKYIYNKSLGSASKTRNMGIKIANGEFIAFLDDDDIWFPDKLELQLNELMKSPEASGCFCQSLWVEDEKVLKSTLSKSKDVSFENGGPTSTWLIKKEVFDQIGVFDEDLPVEEDGELLVRFNKNFKSTFVNKPLYVHYYYTGQITSNNKNKIIGMGKMLQKHYSIFSKREKSQIYLKIAIFKLFDNQKDITYILLAIKNHFLSPSKILFLLIFLLPRPITKFTVNKLLDIKKYPKTYVSRYR
jgi:glycosyltransferase involved in cell wall biosynthesis